MYGPTTERGEFVTLTIHSFILLFSISNPHLLPIIHTFCFLLKPILIFSNPPSLPSSLPPFLAHNLSLLIGLFLQSRIIRSNQIKRTQIKMAESRSGRTSPVNCFINISIHIILSISLSKFSTNYSMLNVAVVVEWMNERMDA